MRKIVTFLIVAVLAVSMMVPTAFAAGTTSYTKEVAAGETVTVAFVMNESVTLSTFRGIITTDLAVSGVTSSVGSVTYNHPNFNVVQSSGDVTVGAGETLFALTVTIPADAQPNSQYTVSVELQKGANGEGELVGLAGTSTVTLKIPCDHSQTETVPGYAATCTAAGKTDGTKCSICGETIVAQQTIDPLGHDMQETAAAVAPGCETTGKTAVKTCSRCGLTEGGDDVAATGHTPAAAVQENVKDATCTKPGSYDEVVYCSVCGKELSRKTVTGQTLPHNWKDATCTEPKTCSACGATEGNPAGHKWLDATCTDPEKCSVCGVAKDGSTALGHDWKDADCTHPKTCKVCGETEGKALGHKEVYPAANITEKTHDVFCERCNKLIIDNEAHFDTDKDGKCDGCGAKMPKQPTTKPTEDDKKDDQPKNGDITPYPVYFLMAAMAIVAVAYGLKRKFDI